jgi:hypothetical protein
MVNGSCIVVIPVNNVEDGVATRYARNICEHKEG